jgi:hypothetical protein
MVSGDPESFADLDGHEGETKAQSGNNNSPCTAATTPSGCFATASQPGSQGEAAAQQKKKGSGTAGVIYNETSTLRQKGKSTGPDLHNARVAIAQVIDINESKAKVASPVVRDNLKDPTAAAAWKDSQAAVREAGTAPDGTNGATHFFLDGGNTLTPTWVTQGKVVESFGPFTVAADTHDFSKGQQATILIIQYPAPK